MRPGVGGSNHPAADAAFALELDAGRVQAKAATAAEAQDAALRNKLETGKT
jgi:hypothetical protein